MSLSSAFSGIGQLSRGSFDDKNFLDDLSDEELVNCVIKKESELKRLKLENNMFIEFFKTNDPACVDGLIALLKVVGKPPPEKLDKRVSNLPLPLPTHSGYTMSRRSVRMDSVTSFSSIAEGKGPKINLTQKIDMVARAMEDAQVSLEDFLQKTHVIRRNLNGELEEFSLRESDIKEARDIFEYSVTNGGASLVLTNYKKYVQKQEIEFIKLKKVAEEKRKLISEAGEECLKKKAELDKIMETYKRIKMLKSTYRVPDAIEYVKIKNKLYDKNNSIKVWLRRKKIQDITINACLRQMKNITGRSNVDPAWLEEAAAEEPSIEDDDDEDINPCPNSNY
ncbi:hypothetical protein NQ317_014225 [Molorchus minor]|uniref:DUF4201 domain-containing protein n=1 Tax=Molorchus minor TaxID=1323400 RepID=A0ABQ9JWY3_9CUCU|nr:hypothetical protein NQ317_014225 [Molorchus minor]